MNLVWCVFWSFKDSFKQFYLVATFLLVWVSIFKNHEVFKLSQCAYFDFFIAIYWKQSVIFGLKLYSYISFAEVWRRKAQFENKAEFK